MNKHLKVSLALTALSLTTIGLLTGCNSSTDLEGKIDANHVELQSALRDAIKKAENELKTAQDEIQALIASGDELNSSKLAAEVEQLQLSIETAKQLANDGTTKATAELLAAIESAKTFAIEASIENVANAQTELESLIATGDLAMSDKLDQTAANLVEAIELAEKVAVESDAATKAELLEVIANVKAEAIQSVANTVDEKAAEITQLVNDNHTVLSAEVDSKLAVLNSAIEATQLLCRQSDDEIRNEFLELVNSAKAETTNALAVSLNNLSEELTTKIEMGDAANSAEIAELLEKMNAAIEASKKLAEDNDAILKDELLIQIAVLRADMEFAIADAVELAKTELKALLANSDIAHTDALNAEVAKLVDMINAAEALAKADTEAAKAELLDAITAAKEEMATELVAKTEELAAEFEAKFEENGTVLVGIIGNINQIQSMLNGLVDADSSLANEIEAVRAEFAYNLEEAINAAKKELNNNIYDTISTEIGMLDDLITAAKEFSAAEDAAIRYELEIAIANAEAAMKVHVKAEIKAAMDELRAEVAGDMEKLDETVAKVETLLADVEGLKDSYTDIAALLESARAEVLSVVQARFDQLVEDMAAQKEEVLEIVANGDQANAQALSDAKLALENLIKEVQSKIDVLSKQDYEFHGKIQGIYDELTASIAATRTASMKLADWNAATDDLVADNGGLDRLKELFESYEAKKTTYIGNDFVKVEELYADYWVRMLRSTSTEDIERLLVEFDKDAAAVRTWPDAIYDALMEVGSSVEDVEYDADGVKLDYVASLLAEAHAFNNPDIEAAILAYGENGVNLDEIYATYRAQYITLLKQSNGQGIKDRMDALVDQPVIWTDSNEPDSLKMLLASIREEYDGWISDPANALENVEGFADTYAEFVAFEARFAALCDAKAEADSINALIPDYLAGVEANGATWMNDLNVNSVKDKAAAWIAMYFSGEYAGEIEASSANYNMLDHAALAELVEAFEAKVAAFKEASLEFARAVDAIGEVNLLSWDEINVALSKYGDLVLSRDLTDFEYLFDDAGNSPSSYYEILVDKYGEYRTLKASAYKDYVEAFTPVNGLVVSIYDGAKVDAILAWYETYGVSNGLGGYTFDNGDAGTGYVLGGGLTVDTADYEMVAQMKVDYDVLVVAKNLEVAALEAAINNIGTVTFGKADYIASVRNAYENYLAGTNMPGDYFVAEQFAINPALPGYEVSNYETLVLAEESLADLQKQVRNIKNLILTHADYAGYGDFVDAADRDSFDMRTAVIEKALEKFYVENSYSYDDAFSAEELAKVATSRLAVYKYDKSVELVKYTDEFKMSLEMFKLSDMDREVLINAANTVRDQGLLAIDNATDANAVDAALELAFAKFKAFKDSVVVYEEYVVALALDESIDADAKAELTLKMALSYETTMSRVVVSGNIDDVEQNVKFIVDELDSLYPLA